MASVDRYSSKFSSVWAAEIIEYLQIREKSGYNVTPMASNLLKLDRFCNERHLAEKIFTAEDVDAYILPRGHEAPGTRYHRVNAAKIFFEWLLTQGIRLPRHRMSLWDGAISSPISTLRRSVPPTSRQLIPMSMDSPAAVPLSCRCSSGFWPAMV